MHRELHAIFEPLGSQGHRLHDSWPGDHDWRLSGATLLVPLLATLDSLRAPARAADGAEAACDELDELAFLDEALAQDA